MKSVLIRGVPPKLQKDGWWLSLPEANPAQTRTRSPRWGLHLGALAMLLAAGDVLTWGTAPGVSLAIFACLCVACAVAMWPGGASRRQIALAGGGTALAVLPLVELVQPLSLLVAMAGVPLTLSLAAGCRGRGVVRFWWRAPWFSLCDAAQVSLRAPPGFIGRLTVSWALPLIVGTVFAALLILANPIFDAAFAEAVRFELALPEPHRIVFWLCCALLIWPALQLTRFAPALAPARAAKRQGPPQSARLINGGSILRSLAVFNAMFAIQNGMDFVVLSTGVGLPDGLTYAEYAHRGAYPLILLALLSGAFALLARPFVPMSPLIRSLLLVWVAQTVWLTLSSLLRLDLYVDSYGLTRLRLAAAIWMGVVLSGLLLILWQIAQARSNGWLLRRVGVLGGAVVYVCCFVSFDAAIARYNLTYDDSPDRGYLCGLGEGAAPALLAVSPTFCRSGYSNRAVRVSAPNDWREWGFRNARVRHSLAHMTAPDVSP